MPASSPLGKDIIKKWFENHKKEILSIVDVGVGEGTYYNLLGPDYFWTGIEVWFPYVIKFNLTQKYPVLIIGDVRNVDIPKADCIILGDVVEHTNKTEATILLLECLKRAKHVVISIPLGVYHQGELEGNPHERHLSTWQFDEIYNLTRWEIAEQIPVNPAMPDVMKIGIFIK